MSSQAETMVFLKQHLPMKEVLEVTRERFREIDGILLQAQINKHDQSHQIRTAVFAAQAMRELGFSHREIMQATTGGLIHDVGYNRPDDAEKDSDDGYNVGKKAKFKKHALNGAIEVEERLQRILKVVRKKGVDDSVLSQLVTYKDENGDIQMIDEEDIERIGEAILNHNDYGKNKAGYDPRQIGKGALMVQLFDKLDICKKRVYKEHMSPSSFVEGSGEYDEQYFHKLVPYCISHYEPKMDQKNGHMEMTYHVNVGDFRDLMRNKYPNYNYGEDDYVQDFQRAYTKNCRIAAEAAGVVLDNQNGAGTLTVILDFGNGRTEELTFSRPNREIYGKEVEGFRPKLGDVLKSTSRDAA